MGEPIGTLFFSIQPRIFFKDKPICLIILFNKYIFLVGLKIDYEIWRLVTLVNAVKLCDLLLK